MPNVAAFVDAMREAFGRDSIDAAIRAGLRGEPHFYAEEGGRRIGTPLPKPAVVFECFGPDRWERRSE